MNSKHYVGQNVSKFAAEGMTRPVDGIVLVVDEDHEYRAGNQLGEVLEIQCPYGTQAMADALLASLKNRSYMGYTAENAVIDPQAELGDGVTVNGHYTLLANRKIKIGSGRMAEMSAPGESELDHEYKSGGSYETRIERKLAQTRSSITKTAEEIRAEVAGVNGALSKLELAVNGISLSVTGALGGTASIELSVGGNKKTGTIPLNNVRQSFQDDASAIAISAGLVSFNSNTFAVNSNNFNVTAEGVITAKAGTIGNWGITATTISQSLTTGGHTYAVTLANYANDNPDSCVFHCSVDDSDTFWVHRNGKLYASNAEIAGSITATGGKIGGWNISSNGMVYETANGMHRVTLRYPEQSSIGTGVFYISSRTSASGSWSYPFRVNGDGTCKATAFELTGDSKVNGVTLAGTNTNTGTISGGTISKPSISGGTLGGSTGGTYIGTVSGGTLSSCTTGGTSLRIGDAGNIGVNGSFPRLYGEASSLYGGTGYIIQGPSGATESGNLIVNGNITCRGTKPRTIDTAHFGSRQLDAFETPLPTFSDYGTAILDENGVFHIIIDPIFAETVDGAYLPTVFLTKYGQGDIWVERVEHDIVAVHGTPGLRFAWETRYAQGNLAVERLRVKDYDEPDMSGERDYSTEANIDLEVNSIDYALAGYEYFTEFERSIEAA